MKKKFSVGLFILGIINILFIYNVTAYDYIVFDTKLDVEPNKVWKINFSNELDSNSLKDDAILVLDSNENKINVDYKLKLGDLSVLEIYPPEDNFDEGNYSLGETYTLYITNKIKDISGNPLSKQIKMKFIIKETMNDFATAKVEMASGALSNFKVITIKETTLKSATKYWVENQFSEYDNEKAYIGAKTEVIISTNNTIVHFYDAEDNEIASGLLNVSNAGEDISFSISH